ncbi:MAG: universal stress protein [Bryobacteraceae bacterium]
MMEKILIAHDGSEGAQRAFDTALALAKRLGASLDMISVEERSIHDGETIDEVSDEIEEQNGYFEQLASQCKRHAALSGIALSTSVVRGHEVKAVVEFARERGFDLLVIGYTGHSRIYEHLWGGTSQNLTRMAPCNVLVVK